MSTQGACLAGVGQNSCESASKSRALSAQPVTSLFKRMIDTSHLDVRYEPKAVRIVSKMHLYNVLTTFLWETKAFAVMLVGVGVKLALYNPKASPEAHFAQAQRLELGLSLAVC